MVYTKEIDLAKECGVDTYPVFLEKTDALKSLGVLEGILTHGHQDSGFLIALKTEKEAMETLGLADDFEPDLSRVPANFKYLESHADVYYSAKYSGVVAIVEYYSGAFGSMKTDRCRVIFAGPEDAVERYASEFLEKIGLRKWAEPSSHTTSTNVDGY